MVGGMGTRLHAFLERHFTHPGRLYIGFPYIILSRRVSLMFGLYRVFHIIVLHRGFLMFELHRVFLVSARMCKVTLEKRLHTCIHTINHSAHPLLYIGV